MKRQEKLKVPGASPGDFRAHRQRKGEGEKKKPVYLAKASLDQGGTHQIVREDAGKKKENGCVELAGRGGCKGEAYWVKTKSI